MHFFIYYPIWLNKRNRLSEMDLYLLLNTSFTLLLNKNSVLAKICRSLLLSLSTTPTRPDPPQQFFFQTPPLIFTPLQMKMQSLLHDHRQNQLVRPLPKMICDHSESIGLDSRLLRAMIV